MQLFSLTLFFFLFLLNLHASPVKVGIDLLFNEDYLSLIKGKKIGLITNQTAINANKLSTVEVIKNKENIYGYKLVAIFAPEHGLHGDFYGESEFSDTVDDDGVPIYSLHGKTRRPTDVMLKNIDVLIYDIQDIGSRSYTYETTLYYAMEEASKRRISVMVLDRPNPLNGVIVDGPMLEEKWRSFVGYINVPYVHGMTIGELAQFFNAEYKVNCNLTVVPMEGWQRQMSFQETGLLWIPTSPNIPESCTALYYPTTGIFGELPLVNIGIGYTLPFKLVGAPWIDAHVFAQKLNAQKFPGVYFKPYFFRPFYGRYAHENCQGVLVLVTNPLTYKPVSTQYLLIGILKSLYPAKFSESLENMPGSRKDMFCKVCGTDDIYNMLQDPAPIVWKLRDFHKSEREAFLKLRKKYLIPAYTSF